MYEVEYPPIKHKKLYLLVITLITVFIVVGFAVPATYATQYYKSISVKPIVIQTWKGQTSTGDYITFYNYSIDVPQYHGYILLNCDYYLSHNMTIGYYNALWLGIWIHPTDYQKGCMQYTN